MAKHRAALLQEIRANRVESIDFDADVSQRGSSEHGRENRYHRYHRTTGSQWRNRRSVIKSWKTRQSSSRSSSSSKRASDRTHDKSLTLGTGLRRASEGLPPRPGSELPLGREVVFHGMLYKTTRTKVTLEIRRSQNEHRQWRRFQLTEHALEYSQLLQRVCHVCTYAFAAKSIVMQTWCRVHKNSMQQLKSSIVPISENLQSRFFCFLHCMHLAQCRSI